MLCSWARYLRCLSWWPFRISRRMAMTDGAGGDCRLGNGRLGPIQSQREGVRCNDDVQVTSVLDISYPASAPRLLCCSLICGDLCRASTSDKVVPGDAATSSTRQRWTSPRSRPRSERRQRRSRQRSCGAGVAPQRIWMTVHRKTTHGPRMYTERDAGGKGT
jgi:hypothetical protein